MNIQLYPGNGFIPAEFPGLLEKPYSGASEGMVIKVARTQRQS